MVFLFLGPPGSGKDTQAQILSDLYGFTVISTGDLFREEFKKDSEIGRKAKEYYDSGIWVPDDITYTILKNHINETKPEKIILTGAVRRGTQIPLLKSTLELINRPLKKVLYFQLSDEESLNRIAYRVTDKKTGLIYNLKSKLPPVDAIIEQRELDLNIEASKKRLQEVRKYDADIIDEYKNQNLLEFVDASKSIDEITSIIKDLVSI